MKTQILTTLIEMKDWKGFYQLLGPTEITTLRGNEMLKTSASDKDNIRNKQIQYVFLSENGTCRIHSKRLNPWTFRRHCQLNASHAFN